MREKINENIISEGEYSDVEVSVLSTRSTTTSGGYTPPSNPSAGSGNTTTTSGGYNPPSNPSTGGGNTTTTSGGYVPPSDPSTGGSTTTIPTTNPDGEYKEPENPSQGTPGTTCCQCGNNCVNVPTNIKNDDPQVEKPENTTPESKFEDPIDIATGAHVISNILIKLFAGQRLTLKANYNSSKLTNGSLGVGWSHNYEKHITTNGSTITVYESPSTYNVYWACEGSNIYTCNATTKNGYTLTVTNDEEYPYCLNCNKERLEYFNAEGNLAKVVNHHGFVTLIAYGDNIITITDTITGKHIFIEKNSTGKIIRVYDDNNRETILTYCNDYLINICDVMGNSLTYSYDVDGRIQSGTDSRGIRYFENTYDSEGRIISQKDGENSPASTITYGTHYLGEKRILKNRNGNTRHQMYNDKGMLIQVIDENGNNKSYAYDSSFNIIEERDSLNKSINTIYNNFNKPSQITDKNGNTTNYNYDANGNVTVIVHPNNASEIFAYNERNQIERYTDLRGTVTEYTYYENGLPKSKKVGNKPAHTYEYANGLLVKEKDPLSSVIEYEYNDLGLVYKKKICKYAEDNETLQISYTTEYEYDLAGNITKITDTNSKTIEYTYDTNYQKVSSKDANGNVTQYTYNGNMKPVKTIYADGGFVENEYDNEDRIIKVTDQLGNSTVTVYDPAGRVSSRTFADGGTVAYEYDGNGRLIKETNHYGAILNKTYDAAGNVLTSTIKMSANDNNVATTVYTYDNVSRLVSKTLPNGAVTTYTYDAAGDLLSESTVLDDNTNIVKSYEYDAYGNKIKFTDSNGNITTYSYDANNNLVSVKHYTETGDTSENAPYIETKYEYDFRNLLIKVTDANNHSIRYGYDALGRRTHVTDARGNTIETVYDANGNVVRVVDAKGKDISITEYNEMNLARSVTYASNKTTAYTYNKLGKPESITETIGENTLAHTYSYDTMGRNTEVQEPTSNVCTAEYDKLGNVIELKGPSNGITQYTYDALGRLVEETTTSSGVLKYTYNEINLKNSFKNARGNLRKFSYDSLGRITGYRTVVKDEENDEDEVELDTATFTYDLNGNVLTATDSEGTVRRKFDALNRVVEYTDTLNKTVKYAYDNVGNLSTITYPDNTSVSYEYDENNNLVKVTDWANRITTYTYDENNLVTSVTKPDGTITTTTYDDAHRVVFSVDKKGNNVVSGFEYVYDQLGRIISETNLAKDIKLCYTYDSLSRVIKRETISPANSGTIKNTENFNYNPAGNMTIGLDESVVYDVNNRITSYNGQTVTYDPDGNMVSSPLGAFEYDSANRLISANGYTYIYDVENIRVKKAYGDTETTYTHNANSKLSQLLMKTENGVTTKYVYGLGLIYEETTNDIKVYHYDYRGSTVALTDSTGEVTDTFEYDTYGSMTARTGTTVTPFLYNGRDGVMSDENGLVYMRARYYSPVLKRFINADVVAGSIANAITLNRYAYANGNPVSNIDPFGLSAERGGGSGKKHLPIAFGVESAYDGFTFDNILEYSSLICLNQGPISINSTYIKDYSNLPYSVLMMFSGRKIHELIEKDIITNYGEDMKSEVAITRNDGKPGRADLLNKEGELWEIKKNNHAQILLGYRQIRKYNGGYFKVDEEIKSISLGGYLPSGCVNYGGTNVDYFYYDNGLILYNYPSKRNEAKKDEGVESSAEIPIAIAVYGALGYALAHAGYSNLTTNNNYGNMVYFSNVNGPEFEHMYDYYDNEDEAA